MPVGQNQSGEDEEAVDPEIAATDQTVEAREMQVKVGVIGKNPKRQQAANRSQIRQNGMPIVEPRHNPLFVIGASNSQIQKLSMTTIKYCKRAKNNT